MYLFVCLNFWNLWLRVKFLSREELPFTFHLFFKPNLAGGKQILGQSLCSLSCWCKRVNVSKWSKSWHQRNHVQCSFWIVFLWHSFRKLAFALPTPQGWKSDLFKSSKSNQSCKSVWGKVRVSLWSGWLKTQCLRRQERQYGQDMLKKIEKVGTLHPWDHSSAFKGSMCF